MRKPAGARRDGATEPRPRMAPFGRPGAARRLRPLAAVLLASVLSACLASAARRAQAADSAVVFMYHRFGEAAYPSTSIRLDQFKAHIAELGSGRYRVLPVAEIVAALRDGRPLPEFAVGLSIDDAYASAYTQAWPLLRRAGLPFTLFVATELIDRKAGGVMSWVQIRELARAGVTIGAHSASHLSMAAADALTVRDEIDRSNARFRAELGRVPTLFAYPFGEASLATIELAGGSGYAAAFGQHSGAVHGGSDFRYLPRFAMNEHYGTPERFRQAAQSLPLRVSDFAPRDPLLRPSNNPPAIGFAVDAAIAARLGELTCYSSHQGRVAVTRAGERRVELKMTAPFPPGRGRINCTLQEPDGRWRWFGTQFYVPRG